MRRLARATSLAVLLAAFAIASLAGDDAQANVAYESPYTFDQTYGSALRLLRVDLGLKITEKDPANGYLMFEYTSPESGKRVYTGSMELVRGKDGVHVSVQLPAMPRYHEQMIIDALAKKLSSEHGDPPKKTKGAPAPTPAPEGDAGPPDASSG